VAANKWLPNEEVESSRCVTIDVAQGGSALFDSDVQSLTTLGIAPIVQEKEERKDDPIPALDLILQNARFFPRLFVCASSFFFPRDYGIVADPRRDSPSG